MHRVVTGRRAPELTFSVEFRPSLCTEGANDKDLHVFGCSDHFHSMQCRVSD